MRTIKIRGKASHNGEWLYGGLINIHGEYHILGEDDMREDGHHVTQDNDCPTWVEPDTIGQFTGLHDKDGKEIYEGDIVRCNEFVYEVVYESKRFASFALRRGKDMFDHYFGEAMECDACEVIGNVFDNLDLLK